MGSMKRIRHILAANVTSLLDRVDDPVKTLRALLEEMDRARIDAERALKDIEKESQHVAREIASLDRRMQEADATAEKAVADGDDDTARNALKRRHLLDDERRGQSAALAAADQAASNIREDLERLAERRETAMRTLKNQTAVQRPEKIARRYVSPAEKCIDHVDDVMARLEARVDRLHAEAEALEMVAVSAEQSEIVEGELQRLRDKMEKAG